MAKKVLFLLPYPLKRAPSQRFRVEAFFGSLDKVGTRYHVEPFLDERTWKVLYQQSSGLTKVYGVLKGYLRRFYVVIFLVHQYQFVFIHREAAPVGPPIFEWIIAKLWRKKIIYDFDDAIWIADTTAVNRVVNWVKAFWKVRFICKWAYKISAGNNFLCTYAKKYNPNVVLLPTCVDVVGRYNKLKEQHSEKVVIGWTGSHSTMKYLDFLIPVLNRIVEQHNIEIIIISNHPPGFALPKLKFITWKESTEIEDLLQLNMGLMPLEQDEWSEGKCGFKIIQYMALGIPAIASAVGVNTSIIDHGGSGFICTTEDEWHKAITRLILEPDLRQDMGRLGREKIEKAYSVQRYEGTFSGLFS